MTVRRRTVLKAGVAALLSAGVTTPFAGQCASGKRVLVIGGGPAGLCTAYELQRAGCDVLVFEARPFVGGRVMTVREPFADGLYAEGGAMILFSKVVEDYVGEFELPTVPADFSWFRSAPLYVRGRLVAQLGDGATAWPGELGLRADERGLTRVELWARYRHGPIFDIAGELDPSRFPYASLERYDRMTLADFFRERGASDGAIELMRIGPLEQAGEGPASYSALSAIAEAATFSGNMGDKGAFQIVGGNDRLPAAFAARLGSRVRLSAPVVAIHQTAGGVELTVEEAAGRTQVRGDYAVYAGPLPILRNLTLTPAWSALRRRAIDEIGLTSVTRVYLQFRERFWNDAGRNPGAWTDLAIQGVYPTTRNIDGQRGILESFTGGRRARALAAMSARDAIELTLGELRKIHPEAADFFETGAVVKWDEEPWLRGCQVYFKPGQMHEFFPQLSQPEGRVHFAGDYIGGAPGYAFSALLSARAAATGIVAA